MQSQPLTIPLSGYSNVTIGPNGIPIVDIDYDFGFATMQPEKTRGKWRRTTMVIDDKPTEVLEHIYEQT